MIISFSGPSGSGKSTIIAALLKSDIFKCRRVLIKEEDSFITVRLTKRLFGKSVVKYKDEWYFQKRYNDSFYKLFRALSRKFYPLAVYVEFLVLYFWYEKIVKETILIADKFVYDHEVNFKTLMGINGTFFQLLYDHFPKSYLSFLINISVDKAAGERNKHNIPGKITASKLFHKDVLEIFHEIADKHNLLVIDNNRNLKRALNEITKYIKDKEKLMKVKRIAICGLDGAGKTTIANMILEYSSSLNIRCQIAHFIHNNLLYKLLLRFGYYKDEGSDKLIYKRKRQRSYKERLRKTPFLMAFLRFFDSYVQYLFYVIFHRNKLLIFDRFFYDYLVSFEYLDVRPRSFFEKLIPHVKNTFLLVTSPKSYYERKPERVKEFFIENHEIYLRVAKKYGIKIINTENKKPIYAFNELFKYLN